MARIPLWVNAGSTRDAVDWDPWRKRWVVACREPPAGGRANRAVAILVADWLGIPRSSIHWIRAGASHAKALRADGITDADAARRLGALRTKSGPPRTLER